jgi:hypothetical protein
MVRGEIPRRGFVAITTFRNTAPGKPWRTHMPTLQSGDSPLPEEQVQQILRYVEEVLRHPNVRIDIEKSLKNVTQLSDDVERFEVGRGRRIRIEIPCGKGESYL